MARLRRYATVAALGNRGRLPDDVLAFILEHGGGTPIVLEQLTTAMLEVGRPLASLCGLCTKIRA